MSESRIAALEAVLAKYDRYFGGPFEGPEEIRQMATFLFNNGVRVASKPRVLLGRTTPAAGSVPGEQPQ